jgi:hypothetical protein
VDYGHARTYEAAFCIRAHVNHHLSMETPEGLALLQSIAARFAGIFGRCGCDILRWQLQELTPPPDPGPTDCGPDPEGGNLGCETVAAACQ